MANPTSVKLDDELTERLQRLGQMMERSPHWIMKKAIASYIEEQEQYWHERAEDEARWQKYKQGGRAIDHDTVSAWLDSVGGDGEASCPQ